MWVLYGFDEDADDVAFERELPGLTTDAVRDVVGEAGGHPWDRAWPVAGGGSSAPGPPCRVEGRRRPGAGSGGGGTLTQDGAGGGREDRGG